MQAHAVTLRAILVAVGVTTALVGALMCSLQRHVKRLLAFSSISHIGMFVCGIGLLEHRALAGVAVYVVGHGLTKAALFMCAGVLLHRFATIDEFELHGRGRVLPFLGVLVALGGLFLAAIPPFTTFSGKSLLEASASGLGYGWLVAVFVIVSAATGGAVLRVAARVFLGWGPREEPEFGRMQASAASEEEGEMTDERDETPPLMLIVPALLLALAAAVALIPGAVPSIENAAARFADHGSYASWVLAGVHPHWPAQPISHVSADDVGYAIVSVLGAFAFAALGLFGRPLRESLPTRVRVPGLAAVHGLRRLHNGHIGDYIAWWTAGASVIGGTCLIALR
jgi:multicomponent Na+:H+ antiporter subunit D